MSARPVDGDQRPWNKGRLIGQKKPLEPKHIWSIRVRLETVQFEITEQSRSSVEAWLPMLRVTGSRYLFPSRLHASPHISTRQYARLVHRWVESIGLQSALYGTHSMRRTKAAQIYRKTGNLRAVQLLLGHTKLESTVRYLGIEVDDALNMAEQIEL
jgi:site-specific recombinase XerC